VALAKGLALMQRGAVGWDRVHNTKIWELNLILTWALVHRVLRPDKKDQGRKKKGSLSVVSYTTIEITEVDVVVVVRYGRRIRVPVMYNGETSE
jgi:hypothetical protein